MVPLDAVGCSPPQSGTRLEAWVPNSRFTSHCESSGPPVPAVGWKRGIALPPPA